MGLSPSGWTLSPLLAPDHHSRFRARNNKLLVTTDTLERAIAAAAATPGSRYPPSGTRMPAAIGISRMLYKKAQARFCLIVDSVARDKAIVRGTARKSSATITTSAASSPISDSDP